MALRQELTNLNKHIEKLVKKVEEYNKQIPELKKKIKLLEHDKGRQEQYLEVKLQLEKITGRKETLDNEIWSKTDSAYEKTKAIFLWDEAENRAKIKTKSANKK